ncbi:MAG: bestrophin family ion channel [Gloeomargarita sp. HHBFW_bins_205]
MTNGLTLQPMLGRWMYALVLWQGSVLSRIWSLLILSGLYAAGIVWLWQQHVPLPLGFFGEFTNSVVYNLVLGLLLVFRTNSSYERFWEGRKAWGDVVVNIRNLARTIQLCVPVTTDGEKERRQTVLNMLPGFAVAMKLHLRDMADPQALQPYFSTVQFHQLAHSRHRPLQILIWIQDYLQQEFHQGRIDTVRLLEVNQLLNALIQGLTACERIRQTPLPRPYVIYLRRLILLYGLCLPAVVAPKVGWWTVPIALLVSFILFGMEELGCQLEDPFGLDPDDLPLDQLCTTLAENVQMIAGDGSPTLPTPSDNSPVQSH